MIYYLEKQKKYSKLYCDELYNNENSEKFIAYGDYLLSKKSNDLYKIFNSIDSFNISSALEVGCGQGSFLKYFSCKINSSINIGLDIIFSNVKVAKKKIFPEGNFVQGDAENLPFSNKSFDIVILADIIEHVPEPEKLMKEVTRVGKYCIVNMPIEFCVLTNLRIKLGKVKYGMQEHQMGHIKPWKQKEFIIFIKKYLTIYSSYIQYTDLNDRYNFDLKFKHKILKFFDSSIRKFPALYNKIFSFHYIIFGLLNS